MIIFYCGVESKYRGQSPSEAVLIHLTVWSGTLEVEELVHTFDCQSGSQRSQLPINSGDLAINQTVTFLCYLCLHIFRHCVILFHGISASVNIKWLSCAWRVRVTFLCSAFGVTSWYCFRNYSSVVACKPSASWYKASYTVTSCYQYIAHHYPVPQYLCLLLSSKPLP